jgi:hypothetical protein
VITHWVSQVGKWNFLPTGAATYFGPQPQTGRPFGLCVSSTELTEGTVVTTCLGQPGAMNGSTKVQSSQANSGCMLSGARRVHPVIVGWSTANRPLLPKPINDNP